MKTENEMGNLKRYLNMLKCYFEWSHSSSTWSNKGNFKKISFVLYRYFYIPTWCTIHNLIIMLKKKNRSKTFFLRMILAVKSSKEAEKCGKKVTKKNTCGAKCSFCQLASFRQLKRAPTILLHILCRYSWKIKGGYKMW